ncbi:hypothetical protein JCM9279_000981 [Rhodotorula babjevae]
MPSSAPRRSTGAAAPPRPQPTPSAPRSGQCKHIKVDSLRTSFCAQLDLDLSAPALPEAIANVALDLPLQGSWELRIARYDLDVKVSLRATSTALSRTNALVDVGLYLHYLADDGSHEEVGGAAAFAQPLDGEHDVTKGRLVRHTITRERLREVEAASQGRFSSKTHRRYNLYVTVRKHVSDPDAGDVESLDEPLADPLADPEDLARRLPDTSSRPIADDIVRIVFPHAGGSDGAELWTALAFLSSSSPYLERRLAAPSAGSVRAGAKRSRTSARVKVEPTDEGAKDFVDSDNETDAVLRDEQPSPLSMYDVSQHADLEYDEMTAPPSAYSTFRSVLRYLETGFIRFAPLASSCLPVLASAKTSRADAIKKLRDANPSLPIPLSIDNAAVELFDKASQTYDEWRKVVLAYVVQNWDDVTESAAWKDAQARIARDEIPGVAPLLMELVQARST